MSHALGVYYAPEHGFQVDRDYIAALQPPVIRILDPDVQHIADMHKLSPNAIIAPRTWAIDDGSDEDHPSKQVNRLMADPLGTGRDHAQQYAAQWDRWTTEAKQRGLKLPNVDRILFNSANEPNQGGTADRIAAYSVAFLDRCTELRICACAPCLGVGWPDNTGPDTPVNWKPYADAGLEQAIKRNGGMLSVHEYFYKTGPQDGWRWLAGRHLQCPFDVPILFGEIGIDNYVYNERWQAEPEETRGNRGWQGNVTPDQYAEMIEYHISHSDRRVVAGLIFITDFRNNSWESFNTRAAHNALLARKDRMIPQAAPPSSTQPPAPPQPPAKPPYVPTPSEVLPQPLHGTVVANVLNARSGPGTSYPVVKQLAQGDAVTVTAIAERVPSSEWLQIGVGEWVRGDWVRTIDEPEQPAPVAGDKWARSYAFLKKWEGGYQAIHNDRGNWTGCQVGKGELKGTNMGVSACSYPHLDIKNLTREQATQIFFNDFWKASGASELGYPLCLVVVDTAVLHGTGTAKAWLKEVGPNPYLFVARRLRSYLKAENWEFWDEAWVGRVIELLEEAGRV